MICEEYGEACFSQKHVYKWTKYGFEKYVWKYEPGWKRQSLEWKQIATLKTCKSIGINILKNK